MLVFAAPAWLGFAAVVAAAALWAVWSARKRGRAVSSVRLWQGLAGGDARARRRAVDPPWLLMAIAAVLVALAMAKPRWVFAAPEISPQSEPITWAVRSLGNRTSIFVRARIAEGTQAPLTLGVFPLEAQGKPGESIVGFIVSTGDLAQGWTSPELVISSTRLAINLRDNAGRDLAAAQFAKPQASRPFTLLERGHIPAVLRRAFEVQPGLTVGDPTLPAVVLLDHGARWDNAADVIQAQLIVALAEAGQGLPGIELQRQVAADVAIERGPAATMPPFVTWDGVRATGYWNAKLDPAWHIEALAGGAPFAAYRPAAEGNPAMLWLASDVAAETNWWKMPGFVMFFAEILRQTQPPTEPAIPGLAVDWLPDSVPPNAAAPSQPTDLLMPLAATALALLAIATALLWRRVG